MVLILDGKKACQQIAANLKERVAGLLVRPRMAIIQIGERQESTVYIRQKKNFGQSIGAEVWHIKLPEAVSESEILARINELNTDKTIDGVLVQLPIPAGLDRRKIIDAVAVSKDIDGLVSGSPMIPATAEGVIMLLKFYRVPIVGRKAAVIGRSVLVGLPTAEALKREGAMVTICHSQTVDTKEITKASDIVVVAIGKPKFITAEYFTPGKNQVVVDVGINSIPAGEKDSWPTGKKLIGDVDFENVKDIVAAISPVPGGVGPMTVASLFENLVRTCERLG
jgi:5,10-methylene-tetrahydrofolate dehydrogenase/methenyl tetrahydrofolate cyclohydrolase